MHITLHYSPGTRAIRPRWLLEELDITYDLKRLNLYSGECNKPEYKAIHPLGQVPALEINGQIQLESGAMLHWLADHYIAAGLAPTLGDPTRINYEQWMFFTPGTLEPPAFYVILHSKILSEAKRVEDFVPWGMHRYLQSVALVDNALDGKTYLLGDQFTAADIMVGSTLMWLPDVLLDFPSLQEYVNRLKDRQAFIRATKD